LVTVNGTLRRLPDNIVKSLPSEYCTY